MPAKKMFCSKPRNTQNFLIFPFDSFVAGVLIVWRLWGHVVHWSALRVGGLVSVVWVLGGLQGFVGGGAGEGGLRGRDI